jgi:hypothetical protein
VTSHLTFLERQAEQAFVALLLTGRGLAVESMARFFDEPGDTGEFESMESFDCALARFPSLIFLSLSFSLFSRFLPCADARPRPRPLYVNSSTCDQ